MTSNTAKTQSRWHRLIAHAKTYGFIYPSSEIYTGLQGIYDYGPHGIALKRNLQAYWWRSMTQLNDNIVGLDAAILMHPTTWKASGHIDGFHDLMVDHQTSKKRYRVDVLIDQHIAMLTTQGKTAQAKKLKEVSAKLLQKEDLKGLHALLSQTPIVCPTAETAAWTVIRRFNLMFQTQAGATASSSQTIYLRPETAQGIFVNFRNVQQSTRQQIPFGIAQIGKAFRNEIIARKFIFRMREFEQMEMQFFIAPGEEDKWFAHWKAKRLQWHQALGIPKTALSIHPHQQLAHYAKAAVDICYQFPFGAQEIEGIHSRTDFDLSNHEAYSGKKLNYFDPKRNQSYIPYVIETSTGCDRLFLMILCHAWQEEKIIENDKAKTRIFLKLPPALAPYKAAILPLVKKDGLSESAKELLTSLRPLFPVIYDASGSIGKRYTRQDLIGTPYCITIDHQTLADDTITIRVRDTRTQHRMPIGALAAWLQKETAWPVI